MVGVYDSTDTNADSVSTPLSPNDFTVQSGTPASDYTLPTLASGPGTILAAKTLTASILGDPDQLPSTTARPPPQLTPANFQLAGLIPSQSFMVTQTAGMYDSPDTNAATVTATLSAGDFTTGTGTLASDYAAADIGQRRAADHAGQPEYHLRCRSGRRTIGDARAHPDRHRRQFEQPRHVLDRLRTRAPLPAARCRSPASAPSSSKPMACWLDLCTAAQVSLLEPVDNDDVRRRASES